MLANSLSVHLNWYGSSEELSLTLFALTNQGDAQRTGTGQNHFATYVISPKILAFHVSSLVLSYH